MNYLAITIGPIFSALSEARKTREIWAASYMFSRLMEFLVEEISKNEATKKVLLPQKTSAKPEDRFGAGIYNDRLFAVLSKPDTLQVETAIKNAVERIAKELTPKGNEFDIDFWKNFLRVEYVIKELEKVDDGGLMKQMDHLLSAAELFTPYFNSLDDRNPFFELLTDVYKTGLVKNSIKNEHPEDAYKDLLLESYHFPSTSDIATYELFQKDKDLYDDLQKGVGMDESQDSKKIEKFFDAIFRDKRMKRIAKDYHKYYCIVHADADNMGSLNADIKVDDDYIKVSKLLGDFALEAASIINSYGGKPVYIGGDDLVFFAPVCIEKESVRASVFQLIEALDHAFLSKKIGKATLSFGITITYYKFPLYEAREMSYSQLADRAKKVKWGSDTITQKNAVAFRLLKHSGAYFEGILSKQSLAALVKTEKSLQKNEKDLISGVIYKMQTLGSLIGLLRNNTDMADRMEALFENYFNEPVHKRNNVQLTLIRELIVAAGESKFSIADSDAENDQNLYAILRVLDFIAGSADSKRNTAANSTVSAHHKNDTE